MVDPEEWEWIAAKTTGSFDHLVIATTLPVFLPPGIHFLEAWNEAMCGGRWGRVAAWVGERIRRACDLEHWAAFEDSFDQLVDLLREVSAGSAGTPPATVTILGGDVHTTYAARVDLGDEGGSSSVYQLVCSPFRNPMGTRRRRVVHAAGGPVAARIFAGLARACGVSRPTVSWEYLSPRTYDNTIGELCLDRRSASVRLRRSKTTSESGPWLKGVVDHQLSVDAKSEGRSSSSR